MVGKNAKQGGKSMAQLDKCSGGDCVSYIESLPRPKGGILHKCALGRSLNMPCNKYKPNNNCTKEQVKHEKV